jgi:hypothetical protein
VIVFDEWRADLLNEESVVLIPDVLYVRATKNNVSYYLPAFEETDREIADMKRLLIRKLEDAR